MGSPPWGWSMPETERFTLANLPYGSVRRGPSGPARLCVALGGCAVELGAVALPDIPRELIDAPNLDRLLACGPDVWAGVRAAVAEALAEGVPARGVRAAG